MIGRAASGAGLAGSRWSLVSLVALAFVLNGCRCSDKDGSRAKPRPSASAAPARSVALPAPVASGFPDPQLVSSVVNPDSVAAYAGPSGTVVGRVVLTG